MNGARTIEELEEKLDGVYDLNQVNDCRTVIEVLLRSLREKSESAQKDQDDLKMLALMVVNDKPDAREKAKGVLAPVQKDKKEVVDYLMGMVETTKLAKEMSTEQLILEVTNTVWADLNMSGRESAMLGELLFRMKNPGQDS
jgi:hypothetical protein